MSKVENQSLFTKGEILAVVACIASQPLGLALGLIGTNVDSPALAILGGTVMVAPHAGLAAFITGVLIQSMITKKPIKTISREVITSSEEKRVFNK